MKRTSVPKPILTARLAALAIGASALAALVSLPGGAAPGDRTLFDGPRGGWLGTVRADLPVVVLEEREGWRRVRIEAWIPTDTGAPGATMPVPAPPVAAPSASAGSGALVRGTLLPVHGLAASPGVGLPVLLVGDLETVDREHAGAAERCRVQLGALRAEADRLKSEGEKALKTIDNFRESVSRGDRLKQEIAGLEARILREEAGCRAQAEALFDAHAVARTVTDSAARFEFPRVPPGRYRVVALDGRSDPPRAWSMECSPAAGEDRVVDPRADRSPVDPYWRTVPGPPS